MFKLFSHTENAIYPGMMTMMDKLKNNEKNKSWKLTKKPKTRIFHSKDLWKIEMDIPGIDKQTLSASIQKNNLIICAPAIADKTHETDYNCWCESHIELPDDADLWFVTAELKNGVLSFHVPRTFDPYGCDIEKIIIY